MPAGAGAAGAGWESGAGFAAQHGMTPCLQQARNCLAQTAGIGARAAHSGAPASSKLQTMASASFMV